MPFVVELHPDIKELQEDVLRRLIPLDESIRAKQHHVACMDTTEAAWHTHCSMPRCLSCACAMQYHSPALQRNDSHVPADNSVPQPLQVLTVCLVLPHDQRAACSRQTQQLFLNCADGLPFLCHRTCHRAACTLTTSVTYGCLSNKLELLMRPRAG